MADLVRIQAIKDELEINGALATPPIVYAAPNAGVEADAVSDANLINAVDRNSEKATLTSSEIFESIDRGEYEVLSVAQQEQVRVVLGLGDNIQIATGTKARSWLLAAFGAGTATRDALQVVAQELVSRAAELGLGRVTIGDIQNARTL